MKKLSWQEIIHFLYREKIKLFGIPFIISIIVAVSSLFLDNYYKSEANLLPNKTQNLGLSLYSSEGTGISSLANNLLGSESDQANRYYILLESYSTSKMVVEQFDLTEVYETVDSEYPVLYAIDKLSDNTNFESKEEGNFIIQVWDKDPKRAKDIADYYIELLNNRNTDISIKEAENYRKFIEKRYRESIQTIDSLRKNLARLQSKHGIIELPTQVESYFSVIADLTTQKYTSELKLEFLKNKVQPKSDLYQEAKTEVEIISRKLAESYNDTVSNNIILNFSELPEVASQYYEILKFLEIEEEIQTFIAPLYEQAKMEEAKSLPIVSIVDQPRIPQKKDYPSRSIIVILTGISAFIITSLYFILRLHIKMNKKYYEHLFRDSE